MDAWICNLCNAQWKVDQRRPDECLLGEHSVGEECLNMRDPLQAKQLLEEKLSNRRQQEGHTQHGVRNV